MSRLEESEQFWDFVREREAVRLRRLAGLPRSEWTADPILADNPFTNVKRKYDRTTVLLSREFYEPRASRLAHPSPEALLNAVVFRFHGTIATARDLGWHETWGPTERERMLARDSVRMAAGMTVFTGAYVIPNCGSTEPKHVIVASVVDQSWASADHVLDTDSWRTACERMSALVWGVKSFMAKEVLLDYILATGWRPVDWDTWTPVGPGARRGANRVATGSPSEMREAEALEVCRQVYAERGSSWPSEYEELDLTDVQFQFCEYHKYRRLQTGQGRSKRRFRPTVDDVTTRGATK